MRKEMNDPVWRMTQYLYLMSRATEEGVTGVSIKECTEKLDCPLQLVRDDIAKMFPEMVIPLYEKRTSPVGKEMIRKGRADRVRFQPDTGDDKCRIPLTVGEYEALCSYDEKTRTERRKLIPPLSIKDSFRSGETVRLTDLDTIMDAMPKDFLPGGRWLHLHLKTSRPSVSVRVRPLRVLYDATNNEHALVTLTKEEKPQIIPLSEIDSIKKGEPCKAAVPDLSVLEKLHQLWGFEMTDKPMRVKVRFYPEANVQAKVRRDTEGRKYATLTKEGDCLVFEDDVYGYETFRSWVLSYGSSAVVEKPAKLKNDIIREMKKIREGIMEKETDR